MVDWALINIAIKAIKNKLSQQSFRIKNIFHIIYKFNQKIYPKFLMILLWKLYTNNYDMFRHRLLILNSI